MEESLWDVRIVNTGGINGHWVEVLALGVFICLKARHVPWKAVSLNRLPEEAEGIRNSCKMPCFSMQFVMALRPRLSTPLC